MHSKRFVVIINLLVVICIFSSCSSKEDIEYIDVESEQDEIYIKFNENFVCDASVNLPEGNTYNCYQLSYAKQTIDELSKLFLKDQSSSVTVTKSNELEYKVENNNSECIIKKKENIIYYYYSKENDKTIETMLLEYTDLIVELAETDEVCFTTIEEVIETGSQFINELELFGDFELSGIFQINHNTLNQVQNELIEKDEYYNYLLSIDKIIEIENWSNNDDVYYLEYILTKNDIQIYNNLEGENEINTISENWLNPNPVEVKMIINNEGLKYFSISNPMQLTENDENISSNNPIISVSYALEKIEEKYDLTILTNKHIITDIWMEYVPIRDPYSDNISTKTKLVPYWCFKILTLTNNNEEGVSGESTTKVERINAYTGGDITYGR